MIAFTGEYDGNADVYVMNRHGGQITRVTYHPGYDEVVDWHPTKQKILFRSNRRAWPRFSRLYLVAPDGGGLEELILHEAAQGSFSPDGSKITYNRVAREHRTWKRYRGGTAQDVYVYDFETGEDRRLTDFPGTDRIPMWIGDGIYFTSDRSHALNIFGYDVRTGQIEQLTHHDDYDARRPSPGGRQIVYELAGTLRLLDVDTGENHRVQVEIAADAPEMRPYIKLVDEWITDYELSPTGRRALLVARGEIFTVPREHGPTRNLTRSSGAREKDAVWSPDGRWIAYFSDASGEYEIYVADAQGNEAPVRLTRHESGYRHSLRWSPDSEKLAYADQTLRLFYIDITSRRVTEVDRAEYENVDVALDRKPISDFAWSPDSRYIAYSKMDANLAYRIYIYSLDSREIHCVSGELFNDFNPIFTRDGEHLFFVSNRRFEPTYCDFEWEMVYKKVAGIYSLTLRKDGPALLPPRSDEEAPGGSPEAEDRRGRQDGIPQVRIDFEGLAQRVEALPLPRGNYRELSVGDSVVYYLDREDGDFNRFEYRGIGPRNLYAFDLEERHERAVIGAIDGYRLSPDGQYIIYKKDRAIGVIESTTRLPVQDVRLRRMEEEEEKDRDEEEEEEEQRRRRPVHGELDLSNLEMRLDPRAEWRQIYNEAWRMERDFFYDPNMHGLDWEAMREKYGLLVPHASCRQDIRYIIGELIGELSTSHTYVGGGERRREADRVHTGMLGADWGIDAQSNRYRFEKIYSVPDWTNGVVPPLAGPGIDVRPGDYLLAVNGGSVTADRNIYSYFQNIAEQQVTLLINSVPSERGAREVVVETLRDEWTLRYQDWMEQNRRLVAEASGGRIGYIHLRDTYVGSAREFPKYFYPQTRKKGLVIDGRFNGGGLDPDIFLQRLDKELLSYWTRRYSHDQTTPAVVTRAHMACLTNRQAGSGGDMLPMEFQMRGMGPVIGTRSWGGLVGISMWIELVDGGGISAPDYRIYDPDGKWVVENVGVEPDIVVDLQPAEMARGHDAQLMKAVELLLEMIEGDPRPWPQHEPFPVK
jgi:tricorn protease